MTAVVCRHTIFTPALSPLYCLEFVCNIIARYAFFALDCFARPTRVWIASPLTGLAMTTSRMPHSLAMTISGTTRRHSIINPPSIYYLLSIIFYLLWTTRNRLSAATSAPPPPPRGGGRTGVCEASERAS
jgi:hypothetical protein